jgi:hypothetical protein
MTRSFLRVSIGPFSARKIKNSGRSIIMHPKKKSDGTMGNDNGNASASLKLLIFIVWKENAGLPEIELLRLQVARGQYIARIF